MERLGFWTYILLRANHATEEFYIGQSKVTCQPGEIATGRKALAEATGLSESCIERWLTCLENEQQIEQQTFTKYRIIKVKNWGGYQNLTQQMDSRWTADEQQMDTNKNVKNVNNVKKDNSVVPKSLSRWLKQHDKGDGYTRWMIQQCGLPAIQTAWAKVLAGRKVGTPADFVELCKKFHNS